MKHFLLALVLTINIGFAQSKKDDIKNGCATDEMHWKKLKEDPVYKANFEKYNEGWVKYVKDQEIKKTANANKAGTTATPPASPITLTVAFHDILTTSPFSQQLTTTYDDILGLLNTAFDDVNSIVATKPVSVDTGIRFCLAKEDIKGNIYNQETSDVSTGTSAIAVIPSGSPAFNAFLYQGGSPTSISALFPSSKFINIYIVDEIQGAAGFAVFPSGHGTLGDGIFIERAYLQNNVAHNMNVLIHEMGHYLGLYHVFGVCDPNGLYYQECYCLNTDCHFNGDMVCDTPPIELHNVACTDPGFVSCLPTTATPTTFDVRDNYMDYFDWNCLYKFTLGQVERMSYTINESGGIRASLLRDCPGCLAMLGCQYTVAPASNLAMINNQIVIGNSATLNSTVSGCVTTPSNPTYSWVLTMLGATNTTIGLPVTTNSFVVPNTLAEGNYEVELTVTVSPNCFRKAKYSFTVIPLTPPNSCNLSLPTANTNWGTTWQRATYSGGWKVNQTTPYAYTFPGTVRTPVSSVTPEYDVLAASSVTSDSNFTTVTNTPSTITNVIRVGRIINNTNTLVDGAAAYASVKFYPTKENCKYRIYYLGLSNKTSTNNSSTETTFGFVSQYKFNSSVTTPLGQQTIIGSSESGLVVGSFPPSSASTLSNIDYNYNDMEVAPILPADNISAYGSSYNIMKAWRYVDVDYSEFVDANTEGLNTEVTLTFYARSNSATIAKSHSYAYFGIECLGAGLPKDYSLNLTDVTAYCSTNCFNYNSGNNNILPPKYAIVKNNAVIPWLSYSVNLARIQLSFSNDGVNYISAPEIQFPTESNIYSFNVCYFPNDPVNGVTPNPNQFTYNKITVRTLHKIVVQIIKVYRGSELLTNPPLQFNCTGPVFGGHIPPGQNHDLIYCPSLPKPTLTYLPSYLPSSLTPSGDICFNPPATNGAYEYRWTINDEIIPGATGESYQLDTTGLNLVLVSNCLKIVRQVKDIGVSYCGQPESWINGEVYNLYRVDRRFTFNRVGNDICRNGIYTVNFTNFKAGLVCDIPDSLINANTNNVTIQLVKTDDTQLSGIYTIPDFDYNLTDGYNFSLSFSNFNGSTFYLNQTETVKIRVITNINGCTITRDYNLQIIVKQSAIGGNIVLDNNCSIININNTTVPSFSYPGTGNNYVWEIVDNNGNYVQTIGGQNGPSLLNFQSLSISLPVNVRRKSLGSPECSSPDYSNTVTINPPNILPAFSNLLTCSGSVLPATSSNGINGIWSPPTVTTTGTYTFTPNPGQCAIPLDQPIVVTPLISTSFTGVSAICSGGALAPLPLTSNNGIQGTWAPALNNTATTAYTFTPNAGQCASQAFMTIVVNPILVPTFNSVAPICNGTALSPLPTTSNNAIMGVWSPALNNTVTTTYTFTPNGGQCASSTTLTITVNQKVTPAFGTIPSICTGSTNNPLQTTSLNGISGNWTPVFSNTTSQSYVFTPNAGQCANNGAASIMVLPIAAAPTAVSPINYCLNATAVPLTATGYPGGQLYWYDSPISGPKDAFTPITTTVGQTTYTVVQAPSDSYCMSAPTTILVNVIAPITSTIVQPTCALPTGSITFSGLSTSGWTLNTLNSSGGIVLSTNGTSATTTITGLAANTYYYSATNTAGCTTPANFTVVINAASTITPLAPKTLVTQTNCSTNVGSILVYALPATGNWTLTQTGPGTAVQTVSGSGAEYTFNNLSPGSYFYTVTTANGCQSAPSSTQIILNSIPNVPTTTITQPTCATAGSVILSGLPTTGWSLYESPSAAFIASGTSTDLTISNLTEGTYYYYYKDNAIGCNSGLIEVIISAPVPTPSPTVITPVTYNLGDTALPLTAIGVNLNWYFPETNLLTGTPTPSTDIPGEFTYFVTQTIDGCESPPVKITVIVTNTCATFAMWDGSAWTSWDGYAWNAVSPPDLSTLVLINADYDMNAGLPSFDACSVIVKSPYSVVVTGGSYVNIQNNLTVEPGATFDVEDDGSLVQIDDNGVNQGNIIYRRKVMMRKFDYVFWSSPIKNFNVYSISPTTLSDKIFYWNPIIGNANGSWGTYLIPSNPTNMQKGKGYIVREPSYITSLTTPQSFEATFQNSVYNSGTPNNGVIEVPIERAGLQTDLPPVGNSVAATRYDDNQNLIGNPYPSAVSAYEFVLANTNIYATVSFWTHGTLPASGVASPFYQNFQINYTQTDFLVWNPTGTLNGNTSINAPLIASGQGFFVTMLDGPADSSQHVTFNNSMRDKNHDNSDFHKNLQTPDNASNSTENGRIWLDIVNSSNQSVRALVGYVPGATLEIDRIYDSPAPLKTLDIYSIINNEHFAIQGRSIPFDDNDKVNLGINVPTAGNYSFAINAIDGLFNEGQTIYVEDMLLHRFHDLKLSPYAFYSEVGRSENRFRIVYKLPPPTVPTFNAVASACSGSALNPLPTTSLNGITGTWTPAVNNTATTTYTFTPSADQNATTAALTIVITPQTAYYQDSDTDGYGNPAVTTTSCAASLAGYVTNASDCNDANGLIRPGVVDICYDGIDNDCDGTIDNVGQPGGCVPITTTLSSSFCGVTLTNLSATIVANTVANAQGYRFKVSNSSLGYSQMIERTVNSFALTSLGNILLATQYQVEVAVKINNVWQPYYGAPCFVSTPNPTTQLAPEVCNTTLASLTSSIAANNVAFATGYCWEIKNMSTNAIVNIQTPLRTFMLNNPGIPAGFATYNTVYTVRVAARNTDGVSCLAFGPSCTITTPIPYTQLNSNQCGTTLTSIWSTVYISPFSGTQTYHVKAVPVLGGTTVEFDSASSSFNLNRLGIEFGKAYAISVAIYQNNGVWYYGPSCNITMPAVPLTTSISPCGAVISSFWATTFISQVSSIVGIPVMGYKVEVSDPLGGTRVLTLAGSANSGFNLKNTGFIPLVNPLPSTTYTIRVSLLWNSSYQAYGPACTVTTASSATKIVAPVKETVEAIVTPNPFSDDFTLLIKSPSTELVAVRIYDMLGKLTDTFEISPNQNYIHKLADKYPSGVYNIILNQGEIVKSIRVIKR